MLRRTFSLVLLVVLFGASAGWAQFPVNIRTGDDSWVTPAAGSFVNFAATPIPAGFFGAGSNAYGGTVGFVGQNIPTAPANALNPADTLVTRLDGMSFPALGVRNTRIQIKALSLRSMAPITVTYGGGATEQWNVVLTLSTVLAQPIGNMAVTLGCVNGGGTFASALPVVPRFVFTHTLTGVTLVLDCGTAGNGVCGPVTINANGCWSRPAPLGPAGAACLPPIPAGVQVDGNIDTIFDYVTIGRRDFLAGVQGCGPAGCNYCTSTEAHPANAQHQVIGGSCPNPGTIAIATDTVRSGAQVIQCAPTSVELGNFKVLTNFKFTGPIELEPYAADAEPIGNADGNP
jgi:hypothetical protein